MAGQLEVRQWIGVQQPAHAVQLSADGQYAVVGLENGLVVLDRQGRRLLTYPESGESVPVCQVAATGDLQQIYLGARQGWVLRLDLEPAEDRFTYRIHPLYEAENDLSSLAFASRSGTLGIGHLSSGLALVQEDGRVLWSQRQLGVAAEGQVWSVALDPAGQILYLGSAGGEINLLAAVEAGSGRLRAQHYLQTRVTGLTASSDAGVVAALVDHAYNGRLQAYTSQLELIWERDFDEPITAVAADDAHPVLAIGVGYEGRVMLLEMGTGIALTQELLLKARVNHLSLVQGRLAAAVEAGYVALMRYLP